MAYKCEACGSCDTAVGLDAWSCLVCGAVTGFDGTLRRQAKTPAERGDLPGVAVDASREGHDTGTAAQGSDPVFHEAKSTKKKVA